MHSITVNFTPQRLNKKVGSHIPAKLVAGMYCGKHDQIPYLLLSMNVFTHIVPRRYIHPTHLIIHYPVRTIWLIYANHPLILTHSVRQIIRNGIVNEKLNTYNYCVSPFMTLNYIILFLVWPWYHFKYTSHACMQCNSF